MTRLIGTTALVAALSFVAPVRNAQAEGRATGSVATVANKLGEGIGHTMSSYMAAVWDDGTVDLDWVSICRVAQGPGEGVYGHVDEAIARALIAARGQGCSTQELAGPPHDPVQQGSGLPVTPITVLPIQGALPILATPIPRLGDGFEKLSQQFVNTIDQDGKPCNCLRGIRPVRNGDLLNDQALECRP